MPERPDHPDHEQLAAFEAGDGDRRERAGVAAHLAGCPSCAEVVASVERARSRLALLEEPDLPPGLHDRLAAAVDAEAAQAAAGRPASRSTGGGAGSRSQPGARLRPAGRAGALPPDPLVPPPRGLGRGRRPPPRRPGRPLPRPVRRRPHHRQRRRRRRPTWPRQPAGAGRVPVFSVPGEVSAATVRPRLATDRQAKAALDSAAAGTPGGQAATGDAAPHRPPRPRPRTETRPTVRAPRPPRPARPTSSPASPPRPRPPTPPPAPSSPPSISRAPTRAGRPPSWSPPATANQAGSTSGCSPATTAPPPPGHRAGPLATPASRPTPVDQGLWTTAGGPPVGPLESPTGGLSPGAGR